MVNLNKNYNFKILPKNKNFRNLIIILLSFLIISELYSIFILIMIPEKSIKIHRYKLMFFIFLIYFYKIIFKKPLFNHHYLSLILLTIIIFIYTLNNLFILMNRHFKSSLIQILYILNDLFARCLDAFNIILFKYLMEMCYMNGYLIFFIVGITQIIISFFIYFKFEFILFEFPKSLIIIVYYFFKNFFFIFFIQKYNPCLFGIISFGNDIYYYFKHCIKKDVYLLHELKRLFQINFVFSIFCLFIFSEIILFNFCGLNRNTMVKKILKSKDEESNIFEFSLSEKNRKSNINYFD